MVPVYCQSSCATSITGQQEIAFPQFDQLFQSTIAASSIPGATFALAFDGRLIYARGYGCANTSANLAIQPDSLMRVASVSKTFTAIGILQLLQAGKLSLSDPVFTKWLTKFQPLAGQQIDSQVKLVTIQELLEHTGGWDRSLTHSYQGQAYSEPLDVANYIATQEGVGEPGTCSDVISAFLSVPLDHAPGTVYAYSDYGYCVLGRVLEAVSGMGYEQYVQQNILKPLGIGRQKLAATMMSDTVNGEVTYYDIPGAALIQSVFPFVTGKVSRPYGSKFLETLDSSGGWVANAVDLVRFVEGIDGRHGGPLLNTATVNLMTTYTPATGFTASSYYGLGFNMAPISSGIRWTKDGANAGVASFLTHSSSGFSWAFILNSDPDYGTTGTSGDLGPGVVTTLVNSVETMLSSVTAPATGDLYPQYASTLLTPAVTSVVQGATYQTKPGIVPGSWVTIFGTNLATATRTFWPDEIIGSALPTEIDHVLVTIDGKNAPVYFVSPGQLDVQAPADTATGLVKVVVTRDGTTSAAGTVTIVSSAPGFFTYTAGNVSYVAAEHASGAVIGNTAATPGTSPATVGETVELYATGLGDSVAGQLLATPVSLPTLPTVTIGGVAATVQYGGVISPGLFQINAVVPQVAAGNQPIVVSYGGASSPGGVMIAVAN